MSLKKTPFRLSATLLALLACAYCVGVIRQYVPMTSIRAAAHHRRPATESRSLIPTTDLRKSSSDAGPLMYAILLCSFLLVAFLLERASACGAAA